MAYQFNGFYCMHSGSTNVAVAWAISKTSTIVDGGGWPEEDQTIGHVPFLCTKNFQTCIAICLYEVMRWMFTFVTWTSYS